MQCTNLVSGMICRNGVSRNLHMDSRRERIKPWVSVDVVASGVAAGVANDVSVRDKNAVSEISNKYVISMVRYAVKANFVENAMGWSTRYKQLHMEERNMKSSPSGCSDDLAIVWLVLHHLASCNVTRFVVLNMGNPDPASGHIIVLVRFLHTDFSVRRKTVLEG